MSYQDGKNIFEKNPKKTLLFIVIIFFALIYGISSLKIINNVYTEFENRSLKNLLHQYYVGRIIDNNVGRFIKLREHPPQKTFYERPTRNYLKNIAPNSLERKYYRITTDRHGFIGPSEIHPEPDLKIVFLGGSTTECLYMDEEQRFPYLVGRQLEKQLNKKINTYNGGVSANESMHSLNILMNKVLPLKPTAVVLMHNINDLVILRSQGTYWYPNSLKSHVQTSKNVFTRYEFPPNHNAYHEKEISQEFQHNLETFIAICRIRGIMPVLMTQANRVNDDPLYQHFNQIIRDVGEKQQVVIIDLAQAIPKDEQYLYDHYHYTAKGAALAADTITHALQPLLRVHA